MTCQSASRVLASNNRSIFSIPSAETAQKHADASAVSGNSGAVAAQHGDSDSAVCEQTPIRPSVTAVEHLSDHSQIDEIPAVGLD